MSENRPTQDDPSVETSGPFGTMYRRASGFFRDRSSVAIVEEARGVPFKICSQIIFVIFMVFGLRDIFWCGQPFTNDPKEALMLSVFKDCKTDPVQELYSGFVGGVILLQGLVRYRIATTESTADLYNTMLLATLYDGILVFVAIRAGAAIIPRLYVGILAFMVLYETNILLVAHRAYSVRKKMKKTH